MKINQPLSEKDHNLADEEHRRTAQNQIDFLNEVAELVESGQPLSDWQRWWAAGAIRGFAARCISLERTKPMGKPPKVAEEAILLRQAYIESGMSVTEAEHRLADHYDVDLETLQSRIKRLAKENNPKIWGFAKWGANKK